MVNRPLAINHTMPRAPPSFLSAFWDSLSGQSPAKEANPPTQPPSSPTQRVRHAQELELSPKVKPKPEPVEMEIDTKTKTKPKRGSAAAAVEDATDDAVLVPRQDNRQDNNSPRQSRNQQGTAAATTNLAPPGSSHHTQRDTPRPQAKRRRVEEHDTGTCVHDQRASCRAVLWWENVCVYVCSLKNLSRLTDRSC